MEQNYNLTSKEVDLIKNAIEHFLNCMDYEDYEKYNNKFIDIYNKLELK